MQVVLRKVDLEDREVLANLLEKYSYEFSQYNKNDVNKLGLYGYQYLDCYFWEGEKRWAYFIEADGNLAGFVMINDYPEVEDRKTDFVVSEFFVLYKYRRMGIGKKALFMALDLHQGTWHLKRHPDNESSVHFWNVAINEYTGGKFEIIENYPNTEYEDGSLADVIFFDNSQRTKEA